MPKKSPIPPPPIDDVPSQASEQLGQLPQVTQTLVKQALPEEIVNAIILNGDLSKLTPTEKTKYYLYRCSALGLDPATKPFDLLTLGGKQVLYANKSAATQLRALQQISTMIVDEREWNGLLIFRVRAMFPDGRHHEDEGFASLNGLGGDSLGNARLKALTKATRRAILNLCGLGELDESEVDSIPGAKKTSVFTEAKNVLQKASQAAPEPVEAEIVVDGQGNVWPPGYSPEKPDGVF